MLPSSLAVIVAGLVLGMLALVAFAWAWRRGQFARLDAQALVIFDQRDLRLERPWERPDQRAERRELYGPPLPPAKGEWGSAG